jgi:predicted PurR-regulated permease PerM
MGQCAEALILGGLCFAGMSILGLPHAFTVSLCIGTTALIPMFGAWIGGAIGALILLPSSLKAAMVFLVFLALLQTFENHVIYPRTMMHATGISTIWVIASVIVGGAMGGIAGIALAVPLAATGQELLKSWWKPPKAADPIRQYRQKEG